MYYSSVAKHDCAYQNAFLCTAMGHIIDRRLLLATTACLIHLNFVKILKLVDPLEGWLRWMAHHMQDCKYSNDGVGWILVIIIINVIQHTLMFQQAAQLLPNALAWSI